MHHETTTTTTTAATATATITTTTTTTTCSARMASHQDSCASSALAYLKRYWYVNADFRLQNLG